MAVSTDNAFSGPYVANGATTVFPFTFTAPTSEEVAVEVRDAAGAVVTAPEHTVAINGGAGGSIVFSVPPLAGYTITPHLDPAFTQELQFENGSAWLAEPVNEGYDRAAIRDQALKRDVVRAFKAPLGSAGFEVANIAGGQVLALIDGKIQGVQNDPAFAEDAAQRAADENAAAQVARIGSENARIGSENARTGAQAAEFAAEQYADNAASAALSSQNYYPAARTAVPRGAVTGPLNISSAGAGGTNGTFALAFTGGNFSVNPTGTFTVGGGVVTAINITGPGLYIGAAIGVPAISFAASAGLAGAAAALLTRYLKGGGEYYLTDSSVSAEYIALVQNVANAAVIVDDTLDWASAGRAKYWAEQAADNALAVPAAYLDIPNVLTAEELAWGGDSGILPAIISYTSGGTSLTIERDAQGRRRARWRNTSGASRSFTISIPRKRLPADSAVFSASVILASVVSDSGTRTVGVRQRNVANADVGVTPATQTAAVQGTVQKISFNNVSFDAAAESIQFYMTFSGTTTDVYIGEICINTSAVGRSSAPLLRQNLWRDPKSDGLGSIVDDELVEEYTVAGTNLSRMDATGRFAPNAYIEFNVSRKTDGTDNTAALHGFYSTDADGIEISGSRVTNNAAAGAAGAGTWLRRPAGGNVAPGAKRIVFFRGKSAGGTYVRFKDFELLSNVAPQRSIEAPYIVRDRKVHLSSTGSDGGTGSAISPLKSFAAAIAEDKLCSGGEIVFTDDGEYVSNGVILNGINGPLSLIAAQGTRPRITRFLTSGTISKTPGYAKIYQRVSPQPAGPYIWQWDTDDLQTLITAPKHPLQRGRTYRMPHCCIRQATSLAEIDAAEAPMWYYYAGVLYYSIQGGGDATAASVRIPSAGSAIGGRPTRLLMSGLQVLGGALNLNGSYFAQLYDCTFGLTYDNALQGDNAHMIQTFMCEIMGAGNDGWNAHVYAALLGAARSQHFDLWSHDCYGDAGSDHENTMASYLGCLLEFCGKAGLVPAQGAKATARLCMSRNNGLLIPAGGAGFGITNSGGTGTQFVVEDCEAYNNPFNFMCGPQNGGAGGGTASAAHYMKVVRGISRGASIAGYYANTGVLDAIGSSSDLDAVAKLTANGGTINVLTPTALAA